MAGSVAEHHERDAEHIELNTLGSQDRMDTGRALREVHEYQAEGSASALSLGHDTTVLSSDANPADSSKGATQTVRPILDSQTSGGSSISKADQQKRHSRSGEAPVTKHSSRTHYSRILLCVFSFQSGSLNVFALALGGAFCYGGFVFAAGFLVLLSTVSIAVVVNGVRQRLKQIKQEAKRVS